MVLQIAQYTKFRSVFGILSDNIPIRLFRSIVFVLAGGTPGRVSEFLA